MERTLAVVTWLLTEMPLLQFLRSLLLRLNFALEGTVNHGSDLRITMQNEANI